MHIICAHCGAPDPTSAGPFAKTQPPGDLYECAGCSQMSVYTDNGLRRATPAELSEAKRDWRRDKTPTVIPAMIGFDRRG